MDAASGTIAVSLVGLTLLLAVLAARGLLQFARGGPRSQLLWGSGLLLAAAAVLIETVVYLGVVATPILQAYVFLSAAIVGVLSLGATRIFRNARAETAYTGYTLASCAVVFAASFLTPLPSSMVRNGIIAGDPPLLLLLLSSFVTVPATIVLLTASYLALRRNFRWQTLLMAVGAIVLGAGGGLYIASFPVALYYAEFLGIFLLFLGLISLPHSASHTTPVSTPETAN